MNGCAYGTSGIPASNIACRTTASRPGPECDARRGAKPFRTGRTLRRSSSFRRTTPSRELSRLALSLLHTPQPEPVCAAISPQNGAVSSYVSGGESNTPSAKASCGAVAKIVRSAQYRFACLMCQHSFLSPWTPDFRNAGFLLASKSVHVHFPFPQFAAMLTRYFRLAFVRD